MRNSEGHDVLVEPACFVGVNYELVGISRTCANARDARYLGAANYEACGTPDRLKPSLDGALLPKARAAISSRKREDTGMLRMSSHGFCANRFFEMHQISICEGSIAAKEKSVKSLELNGFLYVVPGPHSHSALKPA